MQKYISFWCFYVTTPEQLHGSGTLLTVTTVLRSLVMLLLTIFRKNTKVTFGLRRMLCLCYCIIVLLAPRANRFTHWIMSSVISDSNSLWRLRGLFKQQLLLLTTVPTNTNWKAPTNNKGTVTTTYCTTATKSWRSQEPHQWSLSS